MIKYCYLNEVFEWIFLTASSWNEPTCKAFEFQQISAMGTELLDKISKTPGNGRTTSLPEVDAGASNIFLLSATDCRFGSVVKLLSSIGDLDSSVWARLCLEDV